jgi:hypothetical protein
MAGPGLALSAAVPVAFAPDRVADCPAASELLNVLISPIRAPASLTPIVAHV